MPEISLLTRNELANSENIPNGAKTVTPSDTAYISHPGTSFQHSGKFVVCRRFRVLTTQGDVAVEFVDGSSYVFPAVAVGAAIDVMFTRVKATGTTAAGIEVYY